jgi:hypothetical protein
LYDIWSHLVNLWNAVS